LDFSISLGRTSSEHELALQTLPSRKFWALVAANRIHHFKLCFNRKTWRARQKTSSWRWSLAEWHF
jgi:hypothetical protein